MNKMNHAIGFFYYLLTGMLYLFLCHGIFSGLIIVSKIRFLTVYLFIYTKK